MLDRPRVFRYSNVRFFDIKRKDQDKMIGAGMLFVFASLLCFFIALVDRNKFSFSLGIIWLIGALLFMHFGSLGRPASCADGYYKMVAGFYENQEFRFVVASLDGKHASRFCAVPFKNIHTMQWQDVYIWLVDGENGQELYLSPPSVERNPE